METTVTAAAHNFSMYDMLWNADPVVKGVMLLLAIASVVCWAIILEKTIRLFSLNRGLRDLEAISKSPADVHVKNGLSRTILAAAEGEVSDGASRGEARTEVRARLDKAMRSSLRSELQRIETGLPFLATVGSAAPFVGLFGTVWGIMNSFTAIAHQQDTSLATVAPGIAEALFATALGLAAAIPAVMAYNHFAVKLGRAAARAGTAISELAKQLSRPALETAAKAAVEPIRAGKGF